MAILGDFGEFEGPVPEPPYSYHQLLVSDVFFSFMENNRKDFQGETHEEI